MIYRDNSRLKYLKDKKTKFDFQQEDKIIALNVTAWCYTYLPVVSRTKHSGTHLSFQKVFYTIQ